MSTSYHVYIGPYLRCKVDYVDGSARSCINDICKRYHQTDFNDFCSKCGRPIQDFVVHDERERVDSWALTKDDALYSTLVDQYRLFIPNHHKGQPRDFDFNPRDVGEMRHKLDVSDIDNEIAWFKKAFDDEIATVRAAYGTDKSEVIWGYFVHTV